MTQEDKSILLKDLSARLPYGVKVLVESHKGTFNGTLVTVTTKVPHVILGEAWIEETNEALWCDYSLFKPYLRPMSSMTEEEFKEYDNATDLDVADSSETLKANLAAKSRVRVSKWYHGTDWLIANHFDYRGLIPMGLALEAPEGMYEAK